MRIESGNGECIWYEQSKPLFRKIISRYAFEFNKFSTPINVDIVPNLPGTVLAGDIFDYCRIPIENYALEKLEMEHYFNEASLGLMEYVANNIKVTVLT